MDYTSQFDMLHASFKTSPIENDFLLQNIKLGDGVSGDVLSCSAVSTGKEYALKVLPYNDNSLKEIEIWCACLPHQHIVDIAAVYDNILHPGHFLLARQNKRKLAPGRYLLVVMPQMTGGDLFDYVKNNEPNEENIVGIISQVVDALAHIHTRGFVHGDLKLENILFERRRSLHIRICDFGFARRVQDVPRKPLYSLQYVSPEIIRSIDLYRERGTMHHMDASSDMWALGVIIFMMFARHAPFYGRHWEPGYGDGHTITPFHKLAVLHGALFFSDGRWRGVSVAAKRVLQALLNPIAKDRMDVLQLRAHAWLCDPRAAAAAVTSKSYRIEAPHMPLVITV